MAKIAAREPRKMRENPPTLDPDPYRISELLYKESGVPSQDVFLKSTFNINCPL